MRSHSLLGLIFARKLTRPLCAKRLQKTMSQQLQSDLCTAAATDQPQHCPPPPKLDFLAVDANEEPQREWEAEDDVKGGPLDPHDVKAARQKEIQYFVGHGGVRVLH